MMSLKLSSRLGMSWVLLWLWLQLGMSRSGARLNGPSVDRRER